MNITKTSIRIAKEIGDNPTNFKQFTEELSKRGIEMNESNVEKTNFWFRQNTIHDETTCKEPKSKGVITEWGQISYDHLNNCNYYFKDVIHQRKTNLLDIGFITNSLISKVIGGIILLAIPIVVMQIFKKDEIPKSNPEKELISETVPESQIKNPINQRTPASGITIDTTIKRLEKTNFEETLITNRTYSYFNDSLSVTVKTTTKYTNPIIEVAINEAGVDTTTYHDKIEVGDKIPTNKFDIQFLQTVYIGGFYRDYQFKIKRKKATNNR